MASYYCSDQKIVNCLSSSSKHPRVLALVALKKDGSLLGKLHPKWVAFDERVVLTAVAQNGIALQYADATYRDDKKIVLAAVHQNSCALQFASQRLKEDKEIVTAAVQKKGQTLLYASNNLAADRHVVLSAVKNDGLALKHASKDLQADKDVVFIALQSNGNALQYASKNLQIDGLDCMLTLIESLFTARAARAAFLNWLFGSATKSNKDAIHQMLRGHGPHHAVHFIRLIAGFAGVPSGAPFPGCCPSWESVRRAAINLGVSDIRGD
jgi:hypothetical protein